MATEQILPPAQGNEALGTVPVLSSRRSSATCIEDAELGLPKPSNAPANGENSDQDFDTEKEQQDPSLRNLSRRDKIVLWTGIALMWTTFELDHTTVYNYQQYAASEFGQISAIGAILTAGTIVVAVMKPPIAKISDVLGRVETYMGVVLIYVVSYILLASAPNFYQYAAGYVVYSISQTGMQILNQIIVADITSSQSRGLANGLINLPFMVIPWISAFIVDSALSTIGWRWGIGLYAIAMPVISLGIIGPLLYFRRRTKRRGVPVVRKVTSAKGFFSGIDLGGVTLLTAGWTMILIPIALAGGSGASTSGSSSQGGWSQPWVPALLVIGGITIIFFHYYESRWAVHPVMPLRYFRNASLVIACLLGLLDAFAFNITHTYMYAWSTVVHYFSARDATFLTYTAGCFQVLSGLITGYLMYRTKKYKWLVIVGIAVRLIGYGIMIRLRGTDNSVAELFIVQAVQGLGSGIVGTAIIVIAQVVVSRLELAQATALILLFIFLGQAIGAAVAGSIYTTAFKPRLRHHLGPSADEQTIDSVFSSITGDLPARGSVEREAINSAYSDILRYMTIGAIVASAVPVLVCWFLPNLRLSDKHNLSEEVEKDRKARKADRASPPLSSSPTRKDPVIRESSRGESSDRTEVASPA